MPSLGLDVIDGRGCPLCGYGAKDWQHQNGKVTMRRHIKEAHVGAVEGPTGGQPLLVLRTGQLCWVFAPSKLLYFA